MRSFRVGVVRAESINIGLLTEQTPDTNHYPLEQTLCPALFSRASCGTFSFFLLSYLVLHPPPRRSLARPRLLNARAGSNLVQNLDHSFTARILSTEKMIESRGRWSSFTARDAMPTIIFGRARQRLFSQTRSKTRLLSRRGLLRSREVVATRWRQTKSIGRAAGIVGDLAELRSTTRNLRRTTSWTRSCAP